MSDGRPLLGVPNFSEGRSERVIDALGATLSGCARLLSVHYDGQHNRSVFTLTSDPDDLVDALVAGAEHALDLIDLRGHQGLHPHIGALDVCPLVWLDDGGRDDAVSAARRAGEGIAALGIPVFFYGELASSPERRERAFFRRGGPVELARRMGSEELRPDLGPEEPHPSAGATLVTAREPLVAFNVDLDTADPEIAREIAADLREAGGGLPGVRALGLPLEGGRSQVSVNVQDPKEVPLATLVAELTRLASARGAHPIEAHLVGLAPAEALAGYPGEPPIRGFDPKRDVIENVLG